MWARTQLIMTQNTFQSMKLENSHHGPCFKTLLPLKKQSRSWVFLVQNRIKVCASQANPAAAEKCVHSQSWTLPHRAGWVWEQKPLSFHFICFSGSRCVSGHFTGTLSQQKQKTASQVFQVRREDSYITDDGVPDLLESAVGHSRGLWDFGALFFHHSKTHHSSAQNSWPQSAPRSDQIPNQPLGTLSLQRMNGCTAASYTSCYYLHRFWFMKNKIITFWFKICSTPGTAGQGQCFGMLQSLHHGIDLCVFENQLPLAEQVPSAAQVCFTSKFYWGYYKGTHL